MQNRGKGDTRELAALVCIKDVGLAEARERSFQSLDAKVGCQRDLQPPGQHPPAKPVNDGDEIDEPARHRDVGDVGRPHLVGPPPRPSSPSAWQHAGGRP